jgi:hypothetical protein
MKIHIGLCSVHPDVIELAKAIQFFSNENVNIVWHILKVISPLQSPNGNPFSGYFFVGKEVVEHETIENLLGYIYNVEEEKLILTETRNPEIALKTLCLKEDFNIINTEYSILNTEYIIQEAVVVEKMESLFPGSTNSSMSSHTAIVDIPVPISTISGEQIRRIILVASEAYMTVIPGIGMYNLLENLCVSLAYVSKINACSLKLTSESKLATLNINKNDLVIALSVNGFWKGGYTNLWLGFEINHLAHLGRLCKQVDARCIIVSSAHSSEFRLYGNPTESQMEMISNIEFVGFHKACNTVLKEKGLRTIETAFPIPFNWNYISDQNRVAHKEKRIMFQFDTQARKNGEQILAALFDAYCLAHKEDSTIKVRAVCKSTAAGAFYNSQYLDKLKKEWGMENYPNFICQLEGKSPDPWDQNIKRTDIFLALSSEEGVHYFVPEMWISGAHIVINNPGPCSSYISLPGDSVHIVSGEEIENSGTGFYNDNFMSKVFGFHYHDTVYKLKDLILSPLNIASKKTIASNYFDNNGRLLSDYLEISRIDNTRYSIEREGSIYNRIIGNTKWPK